MQYIMPTNNRPAKSLMQVSTEYKPLQSPEHDLIPIAASSQIVLYGL